MATEHEMEVSYQVTGHTILTCPTCGRAVQIDGETGRIKIVESGDVYALHKLSSGPRLDVSVSGDADSPTGGCTCGLAH